MIKYLLIGLLVLGFAIPAYAAPVGLTSEADVTESELWEGKDFGLTIGIVADILNKRKVDIDSGEFEMQAYSARIGISAIDRVNLYIDLGTTTDMEYNYTIRGENYRAEFGDEFIYGVGINALIFDWDNGLEIGVHGSYRRADMEFERVTVDTIQYTRNSSGISTLTDGDFVEYQGAVELAWRTDHFSPYIGLKLSEVEVDSSFTLWEAERNANDRNASQNLGAFVGFTFTPELDGIGIGKQSIALNVEGRFIDEDAVSASLSYRF